MLCIYFSLSFLLSFLFCPQFFPLFVSGSPLICFRSTLLLTLLSVKRPEWCLLIHLSGVIAHGYLGMYPHFPKYDGVKVLHFICQQIWKTQQWPQDWKRSVFIPIPKKGNAKECSNYCTIALISHTSKVMLKILQASLRQDMNCELPDVQAGFRKSRGTRDQIANIHLQPDILECEVKWALGSITMNKASGGDEIPAELFQVLKMMRWVLRW